MEMHNPDEWRANFELDINAVRAMRDHLEYALKMWPGAPARPYEEQEFLIRMRDTMAACALDYNFTHMEHK